MAIVATVAFVHVVIFRSTRMLTDGALYEEWSARMEAAVVVSPGYVSHISFRDDDTRQGVTVSYFESEEAIRTWQETQEHLVAQALGRERFYEDYTVEVARIERRHDWRRSE